MIKKEEKQVNEIKREKFKKAWGVVSKKLEGIDEEEEWYMTYCMIIKKILLMK